MSDWQKYLDIIRREDEAASSPYRLLITTATTTTTTTTTTTSDDSIDSKTLSPLAEKAGQATLPAETAETAERLPERAGDLQKGFRKASESPQPAADVAGESGAPAADVAEARRPAASAPRPPANWQEIDPRAYQPRPFGPLETDADWPGEQEDDDLSVRERPDEETGALHPPAVACPRTGETAPGVPNGIPNPPTRVPNPARGERAGQEGAGGVPEEGLGGGTPLGANSFAGGGGAGLAIAPPAGEPSPDLEDTCWLCEDEVEFYDPSGQAWCSLCLEEAGKTHGWQDLVDLLPAAWQRKEESHQQLAVYAAAHYHGAGRPRIALRWKEPPFHQTLKGADLFRAFAQRLASPHRWRQREAEQLLERLVEHQGLGV